MFSKGSQLNLSWITTQNDLLWLHDLIMTLHEITKASPRRLFFFKTHTAEIDAVDMLTKKFLHAFENANIKVELLRENPGNPLSPIQLAIFSQTAKSLRLCWEEITQMIHITPNKLIELMNTHYADTFDPKTDAYLIPRCVAIGIELLDAYYNETSDLSNHKIQVPVTGVYMQMQHLEYELPVRENRQGYAR